MLHHQAQPVSHRRNSRPPHRRIVALIIGVTGMLAVLIAGVVLSIASVLGFGQSPDSDGQTPPLRTKPLSSDITTAPARPSAEDQALLSDEDVTAAAIVLPASTVTGPRDVATGYPQSVEGAIAQLTAIDVAVLRQPRQQTNDVLGTWSSNSARAQQRWSILDIVDELRIHQRQTPPDTVMPTMAAILRSEAPNRHDVCVLLATRTAAPGQLGAHCETMVWDESHWIISPGQTAVVFDQAPESVEEALHAGFRLVQGSTVRARP